MNLNKKNRYANILLDETSVDGFISGLDYRERPLHNFTFFIAFSIFISFSLIVILRVLQIGVLQGDLHQARASSIVNKTTTITADRGLILDRYGKPIVLNMPSLSLRLRPSELIKYEEKEKVKSLLANFGITEEELREIISAQNLARDNEVIIKQEISSENAIAVKGSMLKSLYVVEDTQRVVNREFSHVVGYVGPPSRAEIRNNNLSSVDVIGRTNLEAIYDNILRGVNGRIVEHRNVRGELLGTRAWNAETQGASLQTTIDADLQRFFYNRLNQSLVGENFGAVGIAMNPLNGEVLSIISAPGFTSSDLTGALENPARPLFNRAVMGLYSPGSIIKLIVAVGALRENIINHRDMVLSTGYIEIPNRYNPDNPARFVDWRAHGWVDVYSAIARSSNIFFYAIGGGLPHNLHLFRGQSVLSGGLGALRMGEYYSLFGLSQKTGIDLTAEATGRIPSPEGKQARAGRRWTIGDTYNISIGQGEVLLTPIALLNSVSAIVNGGTLFRPNLILDEDQTPEKLADITHLADELKIVHEGMKDAVRESYGTALMLNALPFDVSGKTGTAQVTRTQNNAFFVGCGPLPIDTETHNPICILVLIENAITGGLNAVPVAYDVFKWYYENRIVNIN